MKSFIEEEEFVSRIKKVEGDMNTLSERLPSGLLDNATITLFFCIINLMILGIKVLFQILSNNKENAERVNDGVNCLGRIEEQLYWFQQNR